MQSKFFYRPEIDGLRAVAVVCVVFFHAGFGGFSGGFVGVDVFFVISGYLITSIISAEIEAGKFSLLGFYERRARRILPALFAVMLACLPFAWFWMLPSQFLEFSQSLVAVSLFVSNFFFWSQSGYFSAAAGLKPLLHTWSLAVEEQFYLLFPLLLMLLARWSRRNGLVIVCGIALASLIFAQMGGNFSWESPFVVADVKFWNPSIWGSFYLPFGRIWELLLGALIAYAPVRRMQPAGPISQMMTLSAVVLIILAVATFDSGTKYPSFNTILPVVGTGLLLAFAREKDIVTRILSAKILVSLGLISYSLYLWHQPVFAFMRIRTFNEPTVLAYSLALVGVFALSCLTYRYVEQPFRDRQFITRKALFTAAGVVSALIVTVGAIGDFGEGFGSAQSKAYDQAITPDRSETSTCRWVNPLPGYPLVTYCQLGLETAASFVAVWGDSHADALSGELGKALKAAHQGGLLLKNPYCGPLAGVYDYASANAAFDERCKVSNMALRTYLAHWSISHVLVALRWTYHLFPIAGEVESQTFDNGEGGVETADYVETYARNAAGEFDQSASAKRDAVIAYIEDKLDYGVPIVLVYPVPEVGWNIPLLNYKTISFGEGLRETITTDYARYLQRHAFITSVLDSIQSPAIARVRPSGIFCNNAIVGRCIAQENGVPLYFDDDHLSSAGVRKLLPKIMPLLTGH